jgi:peptidoglycan/LPS O-acetylase OafA/YrhL
MPHKSRSERRSKTLAGYMASRSPHANNFDFIRLAAASMVLVSHAFHLTGDGQSEPLQRLANDRLSLGSLGVAVFFFVSGLLVSESFDRSETISVFARKRALRIMPALAAIVLLSAFCLGPVVTQLPLAEYLASVGTWVYLENMFFISRHVLPGVFEDNPFPSAVNGSLWTLRFEFLFYLALGVLGAGKLLRWQLILPLWVGAIAIFAVGQQFAAPSRPLREFLLFAKLFGYFGAGMLAYQLRDYVVIGWTQTAGALAAVALALRTPYVEVALAAGLGFVVVHLAYARAAWPRRLTRAGDYSYGIYLYAFPLQQLCVSLMPKTSLHWWSGLLWAAPLTLAAAAASWHCIERPALNLKPSAKAQGVGASLGERGTTERELAS